MNAENPYFVSELDTGYVVLGWNQTIPGYTLFLSKAHVSELHDLPSATRALFLEEMALVAEGVFRAFAPRKLNYELLGNSVSHAHWHIFPRYADDPNPAWPVWNNEAWVNAPRVTEIDPGVLADRRERLRQVVNALLTT